MTLIVCTVTMSSLETREIHLAAVTLWKVSNCIESLIVLLCSWGFTVDLHQRGSYCWREIPRNKIGNVGCVVSYCCDCDSLN